MTFGVKRIVIRDEKVLVSRREGGLTLHNKSGGLDKDLGFNEYQLLDFTRDGKIAVLNGREWLIKQNTNRTLLKFLDVSTNRSIFETTKYLGYRGITDTSSTKLWLEYWGGLTCICLNSGDVLFEKKKIGADLYASDIHEATNSVYMPSNKRTIRVFNFDSLKLEEVKVKTIAKTANAKILQHENKILISDYAENMYCFSLNNLDKPIWTIDFKKFEKPFDRVWCYNVFRADKNLACVQSFLPNPDQHNYQAGKLSIFDPLTGEILDSYDYSNFNQEIASEYAPRSILLNDLSEFDLLTKTLKKSLFA